MTASPATHTPTTPSGLRIGVGVRRVVLEHEVGRRHDRERSIATVSSVRRGHQPVAVTRRPNDRAPRKPVAPVPAICAQADGHRRDLNRA
jgi:hypothetical protein